jgi:23S rRNA (cytidine1920-2'-O)/16S rRNA (cytidine1409-2'-O)-methyltransferase
MAANPTRLDVALVERALAGTRTRAQRLIRAGSVLVNGAVADRPSQKVGEDDEIRTTADLHYVSRGAHKLIGALKAFTPWGLSSPENRDCLDIGASTGGFTQVLLEQGARRVIALDVGHGQLDPRLARDPRVTNMEGRNIRDVRAIDLPFVPDYIVSDVSFISLTYVLPVIARILAARPASDRRDARAGETVAVPAEIVLLIKPQFEQDSRSALGKDGILVDEGRREAAKDRVIGCARQLGLEVRGCVDSPIVGEHGNHEYLLWLRG